MDCENCGKDVEELWELVDTKGCYDCLHEYWQMEDLGEDESFTDFLKYTCTKVESSSKSGKKKEAKQ